MSSIVDICNLALGRIGISQFINSIDERSNEALCCKRFYEVTRDRVLSEAPWGFATCYADLQDIGTPPDEWAYRYRYPTDCLRLQKVVYPIDNNPSTIYDEDSYSGYILSSAVLPYAVLEDQDNGGALAIVCNITPARAIYTKRITNETLFSVQFVNALAWALACELATPLSASMNYATVAGNAYNIAISKAIADSLNEQTPPIHPDSEFITSRL